MSTTIDERVVEMRFDNRQFEAGVKTSLSTLDKLKEGLDLDGAATVEEIPGTKRSLVRLYQNVEACKIAKDAEDKEGLDGFQYDEYCVEVESWPGLAASVRENYDTYLAKGKDNEIDRSNDALFRAQKNTDSIVQDTDAMSVDHEYRLTLLELGLTE